MGIRAKLLKVQNYFHLFLALYYTKRGKPVKARLFLTRIEGMLESVPGLFEAFNAKNLIMLGRHEEAQEIFEAVALSCSRSENADELYVAKFAQFHLALYAQRSEARSFKKDALRSAANGTVRNFLPFLDDDAITRILEPN